MHELSLTEALVEMIAEEGRRQGFSRARRIWLEIGALGHVEPDALRFCFDAAARGTIAEGAALEILRISGEGRCRDCGRTTPLAERYAPCAHCGGGRVSVTGGEAMRLKELEVE